MTIAHLCLKGNRDIYFLTPFIFWIIILSHYRTSPNLKEIIPLCGYEKNVRDDWFGVALHRYDPALEPKVITRILLRGSGWDFNERADNLRFTTSLNEQD